MYYQSVRETLNSKSFLIPITENPSKYVKDNTKDYYVSLYQYEERHKDAVDTTGSVAGIQDVTTTKLLFDFDSKDNLEQARKDSVEVAHRLINAGVAEDSITAYFSGLKGFTVEVAIKERITPDVFKAQVFHFGNGLSTFDKVVNNPSRIIRLPNTKHQEGLYKIPLALYELDELSIDEIKTLASSPRNIKQSVVASSLPQLPKVVEKKKVSAMVDNTIDFSKKPKFLSNCRYALQQGLFKEGNRSNVLLCLGATYKNLGFDLDHTYRLLKGVCELQSKKNNSERFSDEELYNNVCIQLYSPAWKGGQYSCKTEGWLKDYCEGLSEHSCKHEKSDYEDPHTFDQIKGSFKDYVKNIDKNTIYTGLPSIDNNVFISTGANVFIIGSAGSGKSSVALNILNNTSKAGVKSVFASLDMHRNRMFEKVLYKITGLPRKEIYRIFTEDKKKEEQIMKQLKEEFGNVFFFNKSCPTVSDVREYILACQEASGEKIKLVMLDYFERVSSDFSDDTQASKKVAGELQDLVNDLDIALVTLVQPNKHALSGGADAPIYDYTKIKGSSFVYQSARIIISLWRPFYNPKDFSNDKYMQMAVLKNDLGELSEFAFNWNGKRGEISEMEQFQFEELESLLQQKEKSKADKERLW